MFCSNCGTKLSDNARFCSSCGTAVSSSTSIPPAREDQIKLPKEGLDQLSDEGREQIIHQLANELSQPLRNAVDATIENEKRKLREWVEITKTGPIHTNDIENGVENLDSWSKYISQTLHENPEHDPFIQVLRFYPLAKDIKSFFENKRWWAGKTRNSDCAKLKSDWKLYIDEGLEELLSIYPSLNLADRQIFVSDLKGLANWVEDELVYHMISMMRANKIKISDPELDYVMWHRIDVDRMGTIVARIKELEERVGRFKKG